MEFLPSELLIHIINNIWNLDTLIQLQLTNKVLNDCVNSSYSFNKFKECMNDRRWKEWDMPKIKKEKLYIIGCMKGILGIVREYSKEIDRDIILTGFKETAEKGHLHVLKWLKVTFNIKEEELKLENNYTFIWASYYGHIECPCFLKNMDEVLKWLKETYNITEKEDILEAFRFAASNGYIDILEWLKETFNITEQEAKLENNYAFRVAADYRRIHTLKWLKDNFNIYRRRRKIIRNC
jgi:hypothetical protein